jgi:hypothetical protein
VITRVSGAALAAITLAVAALAGCGGQASVTPKPTVSRPAVSVSGCTTALEKAGLTVLVTDAGGTYPAAVTRACNGLSAAEMSTAVNTAMTHLTGAPAG